MMHGLQGRPHRGHVHKHVVNKWVLTTSDMRHYGAAAVITESMKR